MEWREGWRGEGRRGRGGRCGGVEWRAGWRGEGGREVWSGEGGGEKRGGEGEEGGVERRGEERGGEGEEGGVEGSEGVSEQYSMFQVVIRLVIVEIGSGLEYTTQSQAL